MTPRLKAGDLLAAYGLLRPRSHGLDRLGVRRDLAVVGPCVIPGRLIDLGDFPGLLSGEGEGEVQGDLVRILKRRAGPKLDGYEDFRPGDPTSAYLRLRVRLVRPAVHAWVYVWNGPNDAGPTVASGDWLRR